MSSDSKNPHDIDTRPHTDFAHRVDEQLLEHDENDIIAFIALAAYQDREATDLYGEFTAHVTSSMQGTPEYIARAIFSLMQTAVERSPAIRLYLTQYMLEELNGKGTKAIQLSDYEDMKTKSQEVVNAALQRNKHD